MSGPVLWALSPLPTGGDAAPGVVRARCGELLARVVVTCEQPPGPVCPHCALLYRVVDLAVTTRGSAPGENNDKHPYR